MVPAIGVTTLTGPPKAGKSALIADLVLAMERGGSWLGRPTKSGHSLILSWEAADSTRRRLESALSASQGLSVLISVEK
jgi:RecA-family ATPase